MPLLREQTLKVTYQILYWLTILLVYYAHSILAI